MMVLEEASVADCGAQTFGIADQAGGKEIAGAVSIFFQHRDVASGAEKKNAGSGGSSGKSAEYFEK